MTVAWGAQMIADRLGLDVSHTKHVTFCPFHTNNDTPALSVNMQKATWYCHGECKRGGGVIAFLIGWVKVKENRDISRKEAKRMMTRGWSLPSAQELQRRSLLDEVRVFAKFMSSEYARRALAMERGPVPMESIDDMGDHYHALSFYSWAHEVCRLSLETPHAQLGFVMAFARARGEWSPSIAVQCRAHERVASDRQQQKETFLAEYPWTPIELETYIHQQESGACRDQPLLNSPRKRHAITSLTSRSHVRQAVTTLTRPIRQAVL